jgi:hypothetical protein
MCALVQIWNCSQDQSNHIVHEFFKSDHFNDGIPIIPGAAAATPDRWQPLLRPQLQPQLQPPKAADQQPRAAHECPPLLLLPAGAFDTLCSLSQNCDLVVVTSRQHVIQDLTLEWLDRHYAGLFEEVYFGNHFALQGASRKKSDICK